MSPQFAYLIGRIITLVTFVWLFSTVHFQMCPQMACLRRCIVTLVAFVWLFSTVRFQMCPQMACIGRCIVALVAFMWLFNPVSIFLVDINFCILQTMIIIFKIFFHCRFVVSFALNWVKFIIDFCSSIMTNVNFFMAYFHFLNWIGGRKYMRQISCKDCQMGKMKQTAWQRKFSLGSPFLFLCFKRLFKTKPIPIPVANGKQCHEGRIPLQLIATMKRC